VSATALDQSRPERSAISLAEKPARFPSSRLAPLLLTPLVLLIHGYHPFAGDAGIYVAGVRHILDLSLYPLNAVFPAAFTRLSVLPWTLAALVRLSHLPLDWILFAAHLVSILLFLAACLQVAARIFPDEPARWSAVFLAAVCFTLPVAGTALFVMDPYVTARSFSTSLSLMAGAACLDRAWVRTILFLAIAALVHPLMAAFTIAFVLLYALIASGRRLSLALCGAAIAVSAAAFFLTRRAAISPAYRQAIALPPRSFLFLARWHWYEVLGVVAPLLLFALALRKLGPASRTGALCLACLLLGTTSLLIAALFVPPAGPYLLVPLQILRCFHLIYVLGIVLCAGVFATPAARSRLAAAFLLALLFAGMLAAQRAAWPGSAHVEWPGSRPANPWQQAFQWIRDHTPRDAVFTFNPDLVYLPEENEQGFRAIAQRDHLADDKDAGIVAVQPQLADRWALQRNTEQDVDRMTDSQRIAALKPLGATWLLLPPNAATELPCPYSNAVVRICRMAR